MGNKKRLISYGRCSLFIVFLFFKGFPVFGQSIEMKGLVLNKETLEPIPFTNIAYLGGLKGTFCDHNGEFKLKVEPKDSLEFSSVGFSTISLIATQIGDTVLLFPQTTILNEIVVSPHLKSGKRKFNQTLGYYKEKNTGTYLGQKQVAVKFNNQSQHDGFIKNAFLRIGHKINQDYGKHLLSVKFKHVGKDNLPGEILFSLNEPIEVPPRKQKIKIDLNDYNIPFPKDGFFLVVEFIGYYPEKDLFIPFNNIDRLEYPYGPAFSKGHQVKSSFIGNGSYWKSLDFNPNDSGFINFNFSIDIGFYTD